MSNNLIGGVEVEYPIMNDDDVKYRDIGRHSDAMNREDWQGPGRNVGDPTAGAEVVGEPIDLVDIPGWYAEVLDHAEDDLGFEYNPSGLIHRGDGTSTAGLHFHISPLSAESARELARASEQEWLQVFVCSSVGERFGERDMRVFRGGRYCQTNGQTTGSRYNAVNKRGDGHYEWRLPEPMTRKNAEYMVRFIEILHENNMAEAKEYALEQMRRNPEHITSIRRAMEVGVPDDDASTVVSRTASPSDSFLYSEVARGRAMPYVYRVTFEGQDFYGFTTSNDSYEDETWQIGGFDAPVVTFDLGSVIRADTYEQASGSVAEEVNHAIENRGDFPGHMEGDNDTPATEYLKSAVKGDF